ncbi:MAG: hypothetical protein KKE94_08125 [Gammaproteobacteria bacterium]|nr:hypothetical protein [Gammaproteobacteria bacterium]
MVFYFQAALVVQVLSYTEEAPAAATGGSYSSAVLESQATAVARHGLTMMVSHPTPEQLKYPVMLQI